MHTCAWTCVRACMCVRVCACAYVCVVRVHVRVLVCVVRVRVHVRVHVWLHANDLICYINQGCLVRGSAKSLILQTSAYSNKFTNFCSEFSQSSTNF